MKLFLCIHGHFYQPPRENPWTGEIEQHPSAAPFNDWNERIFQECYKPNSEAAIIDENGNVLKWVNNYEYLNFNFGPTLLSWIEEKHPETYKTILESDKKSTALHNGHGNAIAQVYNHIIMPLANKRDKITQVRWGVRDFEFRFGRKPEGMWLSETACNNETLEVLIDEGIKFTILDPSQAEKIRKIETPNWEDVIGGRVNPKIPYRYFSKKKPGYIDLFFYDGPLSKSLAFDDLIYDSKRLMDAIDSAKTHYYKEPQLISLAVDGETFGHHKHFTERTIAFLLSEYAETKEYKIVNYAEYLSLNEPVFEVKLNEGLRGEGTSWSCIHGVDRWKKNCGCHTGGYGDWNQRWRRHLRNALNILHSKIDVLYEIEGKKYFKDVWDARNDYIEILLNNSDKAREEFFNKHSVKKLKRAETEIALNLLEMQKFGMFMFTSCGWFFSDISGIESQKVLEYAKRTIEIAETISPISINDEFLDELEKAKSNKPEYKNGKEIYLGINKHN